MISNTIILSICLLIILTGCSQINTEIQDNNGISEQVIKENNQLDEESYIDEIILETKLYNNIQDKSNFELVIVSGSEINKIIDSDNREFFNEACGKATFSGDYYIYLGEFGILIIDKNNEEVICDYAVEIEEVTVYQNSDESIECSDGKLVESINDCVENTNVNILCEDGTKVDNPDDCLRDDVINTKDKYSYDEVMKLIGKKPYPNSELLTRCESVKGNPIAEAQLFPEQIEECKLYTTWNSIYNAMIIKAKELRAVNICDFTGDKKDSCKLAYYIHQNNPVDCKKISFGRDECYNQIAKSIGEAEWCSKIKDKDVQYSCTNYFDKVDLLKSESSNEFFYGNESNAPNFMKAYLNSGKNIDYSYINRWAKSFEIEDIYYKVEQGYKFFGKINIRTPDDYSTVVKVELDMDDMYVLFNEDEQTEGIYSCNNNPACNNVPWFIEIKTKVSWLDEHTNNIIYCPETIDKCKELKTKMAKYQ